MWFLKVVSMFSVSISHSSLFFTYLHRHFHTQNERWRQEQPLCLSFTSLSHWHCSLANVHTIWSSRECEGFFHSHYFICLVVSYIQLQMSRPLQKKIVFLRFFQLHKQIKLCSLVSIFFTLWIYPLPLAGYSWQRDREEQRLRFCEISSRQWCYQSDERNERVRFLNFSLSTTDYYLSFCVYVEFAIC
jgi:hypothetical protein